MSKVVDVRQDMLQVKKMTLALHEAIKSANPSHRGLQTVIDQQPQVDFVLQSEYRSFQEGKEMMLLYLKDEAARHDLIDANGRYPWEDGYKTVV